MAHLPDRILDSYLPDNLAIIVKFVKQTTPAVISASWGIEIRENALKAFLNSLLST